MLKDLMMRFASMFTKTDISTQIEANLELIDKYVIPSYTVSIDLYGDIGGFLSQEVTEYNAAILKGIKVPGSKNYMSTIKTVMEQLKVKLILIQDISNKTADEDILRESMSVKNFNIVRFVEIAQFMTDYARRVLVANSQAEQAASAMAGDRGKIVSNYGGATDADIKWLTDTTAYFMQLATFVMSSNKDFVRTFDEMADVQISPSTADAIATVNGVKRVDPFSAKGMSVNWLPTLIFGEMAASHITKRYDEAQAERMYVESVLLRLQRQKREQPDSPALDRQIEYQSARIDKLRAEIERIEDKYNIRR